MWIERSMLNIYSMCNKNDSRAFYYFCLFTCADEMPLRLIQCLNKYIYIYNTYEVWSMSLWVCAQQEIPYWWSRPYLDLVGYSAPQIHPKYTIQCMIYKNNGRTREKKCVQKKRQKQSIREKMILGAHEWDVVHNACGKETAHTHASVHLCTFLNIEWPNFSVAI